MNAALPALLSLLPVVIGPLPTAEQGTVTARLCSGGTISIPLPGKPADAPDHHEQLGCHGASNRKRFDPAQ